MINLIHGDCLEVMRNMEDKSVDLLATDAPYGMGFQSNHRKEKHELILNDNNLDWLPVLIPMIRRVLKDDGHFYMFCSWHYINFFKQEIEKHIPVKNILIWQKNNTGMGDLICENNMYHRIELRQNNTKGNKIYNAQDLIDFMNEPDYKIPSKPNEFINSFQTTRDVL